MKKIVNNWHWISAFLAGAVALTAILVPMEPVTRLLLAANMVLLLHFFEEFGWPGGFPWMGMKVLMGSDEMDSSKWNCNNLSSMFGNWGFLLMVYVLPICFPGVRFFTLAAMMFLFAEVLMHWVMFPVRLKTFYNAGMATAVGCGAIACCYFFGGVFVAGMFCWYDYALTEQSAFGAGFRK